MKAFDITPIVRNFYQDIFKSDRRSNAEAYALILIPAAFALVGVLRPIDAAFMSMMSTALAILFGFTFSSLLTTAKYSAKEDRIEEMVVKQTRLGTSYALLMNLVALIAVVSVSIGVEDYGTLSPMAATAVSAAVYFLLFHYLLVMVYLMRYLYLLVIGGALEQTQNQSMSDGEEQEENEITL
jgi:cytochrome c biogenesis factor